MISALSNRLLGGGHTVSFYDSRRPGMARVLTATSAPAGSRQRERETLPTRYVRGSSLQLLGRRLTGYAGLPQQCPKRVSILGQHDATKRR